MYQATINAITDWARRQFNRRQIRKRGNVEV